MQCGGACAPLPAEWAVCGHLQDSVWWQAGLPLSKRDKGKACAQHKQADLSEQFSRDPG